MIYTKFPDPTSTRPLVPQQLYIAPLDSMALAGRLTVVVVKVVKMAINRIATENGGFGKLNWKRFTSMLTFVQVHVNFACDYLCMGFLYVL